MPGSAKKSGLGGGADLAEFMFLAVNRPETLGWTFKCIDHP